MGADVAEDAAVLVGIPEPLWPRRSAAGVAATLHDLVGRNVDGLNHLADGALLDELAGVDGRLDLQQFAIEDGVDAAGFGDGFADFGELPEGRHARLVGEKVLAVLHGADGKRRTLIGDLRAEHQLYRWVGDNFVLGVDHLYIWEALLELAILSGSPPQAATNSPPPRWIAPIMP